MEFIEQFQCLFSAQIENHGESYHIEVPEQELRLGGLEAGKTYRVAIVAEPTESEAERHEVEQAKSSTSSASAQSEQPVTEGEERTVEIESLGDQGDGITRVERGFVVIIPDTEQGERVRVKITDVRENVAFAEVVERLSYYE
ncbi:MULTISPECIES: TRAM domain-containing protein [unclassified Haladaptatus]|uniref:TRAM domain-containing protein n=1 Tax=unclassified Haladaptatus TaxID=2622732 RepID=UPI0023E7B59A|nr:MULTISPECIES: TRAM domain-containing protein [unclassified Haladaptatus]